MSDIETSSLELAYQRIEEELASGTKPPANSPKTLSLKNICRAQAVFQTRSFYKGELDREHVGVLVSAFYSASGNKLKPLLVWWTGKRWIVIDGHHRLAAHRKVGATKIPVVAFKGSLQEAHIESSKRNKEDKLPMSDVFAESLRETLEGLTTDGVTSARGIAIQLNDLGILTARGGKWHQSTVSDLLKRLGSR